MKFTVFIVWLFFPFFAVSGIYKCTDVSGNTEYRSTPCQIGRDNVELNIKTGTATNLDDKDKQQNLVQKEQQVEREKKRIEQEQLVKKQIDINLEAMKESSKNQLLIKKNPDKFSAYAIPPYVSDKLPFLIKTYQFRLADIERLRRQAAEKALATDQCIRVESDELNSKSTKESLIFLINCSSGKSFYFNEQELIK